MMRLFPSSFDPQDSALSAIEAPSDWHWESCERALTSFGSKFLLSRLPLFWQIESPLDAVCRTAGVTVFHNEVENMPVGAVAIRNVEIDTVLTTTEDAHNFVFFLTEKNVPLPRNWFLIHPIDATNREIPAKLCGPFFSVVEEVHKHPGFPL
jgi:hypothetical protein